MNVYKNALAEMSSVDAVLEDVALTRDQHKDIVHAVSSIREVIIQAELEAKELTEVKKKNDDLILRSTYDGITLANPYTYKTGGVDEDGEDEVATITTVEDLEAMFIEKGWKKRMKRDPRMEMVVEILDAEIDNENIGNIVALDLSKMSVKEFERYRFQNTVKIRAGKLTEEDLMNVEITVKDKSGGDFDYNVFGFAPMPVK